MDRIGLEECLRLRSGRSGGRSGGGSGDSNMVLSMRRTMMMMRLEVKVVRRRI